MSHRRLNAAASPPLFSWDRVTQQQQTRARRKIYLRDRTRIGSYPRPAVRTLLRDRTGDGGTCRNTRRRHNTVDHNQARTSLGHQGAEFSERGPKHIYPGGEASPL